MESVEKLDEFVIFESYDRNKIDFGVIISLKRNLYSSDLKIKSFLQEDIKINFETEEEKNKILEILPEDFYAKIQENEIIISFEKQEIEAPKYIGEEYLDSYGRREYYNCREVGIGKMSGTLETPELSKRISEFKSKVHQIKAEIYKSDIEEYKKGKVVATRSLDHFFSWLNKTGEIEKLGVKTISSKGEEVWPGVRRSLTEKDVRYKFKGEDEIHVVRYPDGDSFSQTDYGERIKGLYEKFIEEMKKSGEYYFPGTFIPKNEAYKESEICYGELEKDGSRGAAIVKDGEICLILKNIEWAATKFVKTKDSSTIYVATKNSSKGYEELLEDECIIGEYSKKSEYSTRHDWLVSSNKDVISYYSDYSEIKVENEDGSDTKLIQLTTSEEENLYKGQGCRCILICNGRKIIAICNPASHDKEKIMNFETKEKVESIETYKNYAVINGNEVFVVKGDSCEAEGVLKLENVKNMQQINEDCLSEKDFIQNENGCFCIKGLSEEERLKLYKEHGFTELYENLEAEIIERNNKEKEEQEAKLRNDERLYKAIETTHSLLVPVVYHDPDFYEETNGARVYLGEKNVKTHAIYYDDNPKVQALYGIQEPGWSDSAYRGMAINVEMAKKLVKNGKLHFDVPEEAMGKIIGRNGTNINWVTEQLRKKGVNVSRIILHPKSKEEMAIKLESIEKAIQEQKGKEL